MNESTLGAVPGAVNSQKLGGLSAEQIIAAATPACPAGTKLSLGLCFEESPRAPKPYEEAIYDCKEVGRRLPSEGELAAYETQNYTEPPPGEWVGPGYFDGTSTRANHVSAAPNSLGWNSILVGVATAFRCVTDPS